jgi:hypothetical protein
MRMKWGVLYRKLPFYDGEKGGCALISIKTSSSTRLFRPFFFSPMKQLRQKGCGQIAVHFSFMDDRRG